jgi:squalene-hopene/tetraprenyl-beta-curcumene cyclase
MADRDRVNKALEKATAGLMAEYSAGSWEGRLSSSALATAVACFAFSQCPSEDYFSEIERACRWLADNQNTDGGWGDTSASRSNIATTLLSLAALMNAGGNGFDRQKALARNWIKNTAGEFEPVSIVSAVKERYGNDLTFSTPILSVCALAGILGEKDRRWPLVPQLPFDLLFLPTIFYRRGGLRVVSYALPALIALGVLHHVSHRSCGMIRAKARDALIPLVLRRLERMQPASGGFLEAQPLTGFVVGSLCAAGWSSSPVVRKGCRFLQDTQRPDGSWPIDVNLRTWLTSLSSGALTAGGNSDYYLSQQQKNEIIGWLLDARVVEPDPMTGASGGWSWTDLPGGVPDADDTSAALIALKNLGAQGGQVEQAAGSAAGWLMSLQNRDGGVPTFCRGWTGLPFDQSCPDVTAHAMHALSIWTALPGAGLRLRVNRFLSRAAGYLSETQKRDGSWEPLWFGNEAVPGESNPVFGTGRVLSELARVPCLYPGLGVQIGAGQDFLLRMQNADGGWGSCAGVTSTVEETSVALTALAESGNTKAVERGCDWLSGRILEANGAPEAVPIGLYFARLWYSESLYPRIFAVRALREASKADLNVNNAGLTPG